MLEAFYPTYDDRTPVNSPIESSKHSLIEAFMH
jgi:hypothetical protein